MEAGGQQAVAPAPIMPGQPAQKSSGKKVALILLAVFGGLFLIGAICFIIFIVNIVGFAGDVIDEVASNSNTMVCEYSGGSVTIIYDGSSLNGFKSSGNVDFDLDDEKDIARRKGMDSYLEDYAERFSDEHFGGVCKINGVKVGDVATPTPSADPNPSTLNGDTKIVGNDDFGYLEIPNNWVDFHDVDGSDSLQWSYGLSYIVSLYAFGDKAEGTAKEYADSYMAQKKADSSVTGVTGATVTIGDKKQYTAYQVYMYYPADSTYLVTYWFETEDGNVHYIALEGPEGVENYTSIPESFRTTN